MYVAVCGLTCFCKVMFKELHHDDDDDDDDDDGFVLI